MRRRAGETNITCMQLMHASHEMKRKAYHEICNGILLRVTRAPVASPDASPHRSASRVPILVAAPPRLSCPTLLRPVLSRIGDSELGLTRPALGADYYLTSLTSVKHREDPCFPWLSLALLLLLLLRPQPRLSVPPPPAVAPPMASAPPTPAAPWQQPTPTAHAAAVQAAATQADPQSAANACMQQPYARSATWPCPRPAVSAQAPSR